MSQGEIGSELSSSAERLVRLARRELGDMSARRRAEGLLKLNARSAPRARNSRFVLTFASVVVASVALVFAQRWLLGHEASGLSYRVHGGRVDARGTVQASGKSASSLRFSDGTRVSFLPGARGRLKSVGEKGARIELSGKMDVAVVANPRRNWQFDAGPFLITVTGTAFDAEWRDAEQRLEIVLRTGSVEVTGPVLDGPLSLRAGQRLLISGRQKEVVIRDIEPGPAGGVESAAAPQPLAGAEPLPAVSAAPRTERPAAATPSAAPWMSELAAGRFAIILQQAEERGLDKVLAEGSSDEIAALSDAARYSRRDDVARRALLAQRRRFPRSGRASEAAFLLGRLEETAQRPELALVWYERCLSESPRGTYGSEALGRKMTLAQRLHGAARARPIAEAYLRRFENGTYAAAARALIRAP